MMIQAAQHELRQHFAGGFYGQLPAWQLRGSVANIIVVDRAARTA